MDLEAFYEDSYSRVGAEADRASRWREMSAEAKADHVLRLAAALSSRPARVLDIGCGDGAVLAALGMARPAWTLAGVELVDRAVEIARARVPGAEVQRYDGATLPYPEGSFDLAVLSHVLEHVEDPAAVLREAARVAERVVLEVPLEANLSTRRESKRQIAREVGHIQRFSRADIAAVAARAGLRVTEDISDPLGRDAHVFFAAGAADRARGTAKWAVRAALHGASAAAAQRVFTVHYAARCERV